MQPVANQALARTGIQKNGVGRKYREAIGVGCGQRQQRRGHRGDHQGIDADHAQQHALCAGAQGIGADFQHRGGHCHLSQPGHPGKDCFVKAALDAAQFQVRLAVDGAHRFGELVQCRGVDQMHRERQRHPQHHSDHGGSVAPGVVAQFLPGESLKECQHQDSIESPLKPGRHSQVGIEQPVGG